MTSNPSGPAGPDRPQDTSGQDPTVPLHPQENYDGGGSPKAAAPDSNSFFNWFRSLGMPRGTDRWIGGVASGVGHRTGLDPVLVRGLFVLVALFGGFGVLLYGLAWALLPEPDGRIHAEEAGRGNWTAGMTGALIATVLGLFDRPFGFFRDGGWEFGAYLWAVVWIGALGYFIYWLATRNRHRPPAPLEYPVPPAGQSGPGSAFGSAPSGTVPPLYTPRSAAAGPAAGQVPPAGSATGPVPPVRPGTGTVPPAGAAVPPTMPMGYRPPPVPPAPPRPRRRGPSGVSIALTLGTAMVAAGVVLTLPLLLGFDAGLALLPAAVAAALLCIGVGIVVLGIRGRTSGILGFLAAVGIVLSLVTTAGVQWQTANYSIGTNTTWTSESGAPASEGYSIVASQGTVDLSGLPTGTFGGPVTVPVNTVASNVTIIVPRDEPVEIQSALALGNVEYGTDFATRRTSGVWQPGSFIINDDGSAPAVILQIRGAASNVEIVEAAERGSTS